MLLFLHYARKFSETCVFKLVLDFLSSKAVGIVEPSDQTTETTMSLWVCGCMPKRMLLSYFDFIYTCYQTEENNFQTDAIRL